MQNAIQLTWDTHGRLWVAENYTMDSDRFVDTFRDRIVILDNADGGTKFQTRRVFTEDLKNLMGFAIGYGGVWVMTSPTISFIPDKNADGVPDGPPEVVFDGFSYTGGNMHTSANGLEFGIDGWIYGRTGHAHVQSIGPPGTPPEQRSRLHGSIFRFHPVTKAFEALGLRNGQSVGPGLGQARRALLRLDHRRSPLVLDAGREVREQLGRAEPEGLRADRPHRQPSLRSRARTRRGAAAIGRGGGAARGGGGATTASSALATATAGAARGGRAGGRRDSGCAWTRCR